MGKLWWLGVLALPVAAAGCRAPQGSQSESGPGARRGEVFVQEVQIVAEPGLRFVVGGQFPPPVLRVKAGREVRLVLVNRDVLHHDLWIVRFDERPPYQAPAFPDARTPLVDPGKRYVLRFEPRVTGRYRFVCGVPGHEEQMWGELVVEVPR